MKKKMRVVLNEDKTYDISAHDLRYIPKGTAGTILAIDGLKEFLVTWDYGLVQEEREPVAYVIEGMECSVALGEFTFSGVEDAKTQNPYIDGCLLTDIIEIAEEFGWDDGDLIQHLVLFTANKASDTAPALMEFLRDSAEELKEDN